MSHFLREALLTFVPLFVAMDAVGNLPILLTLTQEAKPGERTRVICIALFTGLLMGLGFLAIGKGILLLLGIEAADFLVAGGLILLVLAAKDIVVGRMVESPGKDEMIAVVPIGTPLLVGPAVLTTLLLLVDQYSIFAVVLAFMLNLALAWLVFSQANRVAGFLGVGGLKGVAKFVSLLLAAIGVMMIRRGIMGFMS